MWTNETLAYFAGILDGEGHISVELQSANGENRLKDYYSLRMIIANTNLEVIEWVVKNFGAAFRKDKKHPGNKQVYRATFLGRGIFDILDACYPYLIVKKPHADLVFKFRATIGKTGWRIPEDVREYRKQLYLEAKRMNKKGDHSELPPCYPNAIAS